MRWFGTVVLVFVLGSSASTSAIGLPGQPYDVYTVAHPDDFPLFFSPNLPIDVAAKDRVLVIVATAGDAGLTNGYWEAREEGAKAALRWLVGTTDLFSKDESSAVIQANGHPVSTWTYGLVTLAFLRLPDGGGVGQESCGAPGTGSGTPAYYCQSMERLGNPGGPVVTTVDGSTSYESVQDLAATLLALIQTYRTSGEAWINTFEPSSERNPGDHPDHAFVGLLTQLATTPPQLGFHHAYFVGYDSLNRPGNVSQAAHDLKVGFFGAYYFTVLDFHEKGETELCAAPGNERLYAAALWRQYLTVIQ